MQVFRNVPGITVAALAALLVFASTAAAKTYVPTRTGDPVPDGCRKHDCSLREAVVASNHNSGNDVIVLQAGKTYKLTQAPGFDNENTYDLGIVGNPATSLTIKSSSSRLATITVPNHNFGIVSTYTRPVTFKSLKLTGGKAAEGGAINSDGTGRVRVIKSVLSGNTTTGGNGGAFDVGVGNASISRSRISGNTAIGNGGGVYVNGGHLSIGKSTIASNTAGGSGGGIYVRNSGGPLLTLSQSTVSSNFAGAYPGGGGGLYAFDGTTTLTNDTFAKNRTGGDGGGIEVNDGLVQLNAVTVADNRADSDGLGSGDGGGLGATAGGIMRSRNSLVARNTTTDAAGSNCFMTNGGHVDSLGHNLVGGLSGCAWTAGSGDRLNRLLSKIKIGSLRNNGGPTKTIALKDGSQAINHADGMAPGRDQRGVRRHNPDIGAFERS
jgi:hypothetical protein